MTAIAPGRVEVRPLILGGFAARTRSKLAVAFQMAAGRLHDLPVCAALFTELGANGLTQLAATRYKPVADTGGERVCGRGPSAAAFTLVGSPRTIVCPAFDRLSVEHAAVVLLHEALHSAGLGEWPADPQAPDSGAISRMVRTACEL